MATRMQWRISDSNLWIGLRVLFTRSLVRRAGISSDSVSDGMLVEGMAAAEKEDRRRRGDDGGGLGSRGGGGLVALADGGKLGVPAEKVGLAVVGAGGFEGLAGGDGGKGGGMERRLPERKPPRVAPMQGASSRRAERQSDHRALRLER